MILIKRGQAPGSFPDTILSVITHLSTRVIPVQDILHNIIYIYILITLLICLCVCLFALESHTVGVIEKQNIQ